MWRAEAGVYTMNIFGWKITETIGKGEDKVITS